MMACMSRSGCMSVICNRVKAKCIVNFKWSHPRCICINP
jgi:hypothetical protein